jgi:hypothetical protein
MYEFKRHLLDAGVFWSGDGKVHNGLRRVGSILDC